MNEPSDAPLIRVLVVDDHPVVREGMAQIISEDDGLECVARASSAIEALGELEKVAADVAVVDVDMPEVNGLQLAQQLLATRPELRILLLTMHRNESIFNRAVDLGVNGYILKDEAAPMAIREGIRRAARGETYVSPSISDFVMRRGRAINESRKTHKDLETLTRMERTVLKLLAQNLSSKEIASELSISPRTVGTHRTNLSTKLGIHGKHSLIAFAIENRASILALPE